MNDIKGETEIKVPVKDNKLLEEALEKINSNEEIKTLWKVINVNAIDRLGMSDHGSVHFQIVANIALRLARILKESDVKLSTHKDFELTHEHSELVILLGSLFHDLGMTIDREGHEEFSLILANRLLHEVLEFMPVGERTIIISEVLHAIISHRSGGKPNTLEAGIVRVADALDMTKGRARVAYEKGIIEIYSVSASAIDEVEIKKGEDKPIMIEISMNNSAGLFQVDNLLSKKIKGSGLEKYIEVTAKTKGESEKNLVKEFKI